MLTKALSSERSSPAFFAPSNQLTGFGNSIRPMCLDIPYRPASSFSRRLRMPALKAAGVLGVLQGLFDSADLRFHRDFHFSGHDHFLSRGCLFFGFIALVVFVVMRAGPSREQLIDRVIGPGNALRLAHGAISQGFFPAAPARACRLMASMPISLCNAAGREMKTETARTRRSFASAASSSSGMAVLSKCRMISSASFAVMAALRPESLDRAAAGPGRAGRTADPPWAHVAGRYSSNRRVRRNLSRGPGRSGWRTAPAAAK